MKKYLILLFGYLALNFTLNGQTNSAQFGLKAGGNLSSFTDNSQNDFNYKFGFYAGSFVNIKLNDTWSFQPEILIALQGAKAQTEIVVVDSLGNPLTSTLPFDFEYDINELSLLIPIMFRVNLNEKLFLESGPQLNFIVNRTLSSNQTLLDGTGSELDSIDTFKNFDFGSNLGLGYQTSEKVTLNFRVYVGLLERDDNIKARNFNIGLEYRL